MAKKVSIAGKRAPKQAPVEAVPIDESTKSVVEPKEETIELKSSLKNSSSSIKVKSTTAMVQFRIMAGSYEHNLLCLSAMIDPSGKRDALFQPIFHFQAHTLSIKSMDIAKRYMVTGSNDEHIRIYDLQKRKELGHLLSHQGTITALKFSDESATVVDSKAGESTAKTGKWLLSGSEDGKIIIWRTKDWETFGILKGHQSKINDLAIHPSGRVAISVSTDQTIRLWNLMSAKKAAVLKIKGRDHLGQYGEFVRWSLDGSYFFVGLLNQMFIYNTGTAKIIKKINFSSTLMALDVFSLEGVEYIVTGHGDGTIDFIDFKKISLTNAAGETEEEAKVWESTPELIKPTFTLRGHTNRIKDFTFYMHPFETQGIPYLISVSSDGKIVVWNVAENVRDQVAVYDTGERLNCVAVSSELVEKLESMKKRYDAVDEDVASESEYESDGEVKRVMLPKGKKNKKRKVTVTLE